jgi:ABC-type lipoprotein release transport system permease subunit
MSKVASIRWNDLLLLALNALRHHRLRSGLTVGAVAVGIAAMVYLISLGFGMERITLGEVAKSNTLLSITVKSPVSDKLPLSQKQIDRLAKIEGVRDALPNLSLRGHATLSDASKTTQVTIVGVDPSYIPLIQNSKVTVGSIFREKDTQVMLVSTGFLKTFGFENTKVPLIPFTLTIDSQDSSTPAFPPMTDVSVYGVIDAPGTTVYVPRIYLEDSINGQFASYQDVKVRVKSLDYVESVKNEIIKYGLKAETVAETMQEIKKVFFWIRLIMSILGLIAVIVASIGMFNTLTVSLLERTREIGIMKALGVKQLDIRRLFLAEAGLMGMFGGLAGIGLAYLFQKTTLFFLLFLAIRTPEGVVPANLFLNHWYILGGAVFFAVAVAVLTGMYPARRAVRLKPIEAIRYE